MYESKLQEDKKALDEQKKELSDLEAKTRARLEEEEKEMKERVERDIEEMKAKIEARKRKCEEEESQWEQEKKRVKNTQSFEKIVNLNVGGTKYTTSLSTLTKYPDSMLGVMFSGRHALLQQEDGSYFVDVDGEYFQYILSYLRDRDRGIHVLSELTGRGLDHVKYLSHYFQFQELETFVLIKEKKQTGHDKIDEWGNRYSGTNGNLEIITSIGPGHQYVLEYQIDNKIKSIKCTSTCSQSYRTVDIRVQTYQKVEFKGKIKQCNLTNVQFHHCHFGEGFSFEGSVLHNTVFKYCSGLVSNKVHFAPWQVSQARFQPELLKALKANGCVY